MLAAATLLCALCHTLLCVAPSKPANKAAATAPHRNIIGPRRIMARAGVSPKKQKKTQRTLLTGCVVVSAAVKATLVEKAAVVVGHGARLSGADGLCVGFNGVMKLLECGEVAAVVVNGHTQQPVAQLVAAVEAARAKRAAVVFLPGQPQELASALRVKRVGVVAVCRESTATDCGLQLAASLDALRDAVLQAATEATAH